MKRIQTARTASQEAGEPRKKRTVLIVLILCVLLLAGTAISAAVLGGSLSRFLQKESHVIPLAPEEKHSASAEEGTEHKENVEEASPTQNPTAASETAAPRRRSAENNTALRGNLQVHDAVRNWSTETQVDLFRESYSESGDETVKAEDGEKLVAPGTSNFYTFTLENNGNLPLDYTISLKVENHKEGPEAEPDVPLEWRLLAGDGAAVSAWRGYNETAEVLEEATLAVRRQNNYTIEWRWSFERGAELDREDTALGNLAAKQPLNAKATIIVYAEESTGHARPKTGDSAEPGLYLAWMTLSGGGLLILIQSRRRKKTE